MLTSPSVEKSDGSECQGLTSSSPPLMRDARSSVMVLVFSKPALLSSSIRQRVSLSVFSQDGRSAEDTTPVLGASAAFCSARSSFIMALNSSSASAFSFSMRLRVET